MQKLAIKLIRKALLKRDGRWIDGRTVSIYHDTDLDKFGVIRINDNSYDITDRTFYDVDSAIDYFLFWYNKERVFLTDEEANVELD